MEICDGTIKLQFRVRVGAMERGARTDKRREASAKVRCMFVCVCVSRLKLGIKEKFDNMHRS